VHIVPCSHFQLRKQPYLHSFALSGYLSEKQAIGAPYEADRVSHRD